MREGPNIVYWLGDKLYLNITNRCSNDCYFCLRRFKSGVGGFNLRLQREPAPQEVVQELQKVLRRKRWEEAVFCGFGEPLVRLDPVLRITDWLRRFWGGVVRVDTNGHGYLLNEEREVAKELEEAGVDKVSVSLNAHDEETYNEICRPRLEDAFQGVLEFVKGARATDLETEITAVSIPEADISRMREMAERMGVGFRLREYIPCIW